MHNENRYTVLNYIVEKSARASQYFKYQQKNAETNKWSNELNSLIIDVYGLPSRSVTSQYIIMQPATNWTCIVQMFDHFSSDLGVLWTFDLDVS